jgi:hypothetical protein
MKEVVVFKGEQYSDDMPDHGWTAAQTMDWFQQHLAQIPPEFMPSARIEFDSVSGYEGSSTYSIRILYERPETPEEQAYRLNEELLARQRREYSERKEYERLAAKYGSKT